MKCINVKRFLKMGRFYIPALSRFFFFFIFFSNKNRFINDTLAILDFLIMLLLSTLRGQRRNDKKKISKTPRISMIYTKLHIIIIFYAINIIFHFQGETLILPQKNCSYFLFCRKQWGR